MQVQLTTLTHTRTVTISAKPDATLSASHARTDARTDGLTAVKPGGSAPRLALRDQGLAQKQNRAEPCRLRSREF
jgi:hypothetical protein